jgi:hypothetical protein
MFSGCWFRLTSLNRTHIHARTHTHTPHAGNDRARLVQHTQRHRVALRRRGDLEAALVMTAVGDLQRHAVGGTDLESAKLRRSKRMSRA